MTPRERASAVVSDLFDSGPGQITWRDCCDGLVDLVEAAIAAAVAEEHRRGLHEVNEVFCRGLSSSLGLEFMRDMHARVVAAAEREACARVAETFADGLDYVNRREVAYWSGQIATTIRTRGGS